MARKYNLGSHEIRHKFLYLLDCPMGLMGRDLLCKLKAQITFDLYGTTALKLKEPEVKTHGCKRRGMATVCPRREAS
jgi:hypothetical protein